MVVAGEARGARGDQQGGAGEDQGERGVAAVGLDLADDRRGRRGSGGGGGSVAGMASAELGATARVPMAQASAIRR